MNDNALIEAIRDTPEGFGLNGAYYPTAMILTGIDVGRSGGLLRGFREWLVVRADECNGLQWHQLVLLDLFPDMRLQGWKNPEHLTPDQHRQAVDHLFSLVLEFLDVRNNPRELGRMYTRHETMYAHIEG
ncbi:hypothetical protein SAMN04487983_1010160 [Streptomyces sp. yr375]|uniref:hypothetical protein n=1 Tax=Streptomyces sp. yr375 TaxID=1761906 RepID=UPI0008C8205F|nr:hypothetical protein [Streptomyces sp. yr375]SER03126.1 hypothetical protein SAMN04487983_1010160 [Streptomyces sp. yr375]